ncbi:MAG: tRNA threonylcarbamoyladenosine dehydratase [Alphaproteobacteria bacterium ADurb.BinA280]|jgi:tRNA threonylcarbamoyladenosine dehydratase|nr:tRNA threonylcarbamoyladenosine dehydratase [Xanthomonadales bacterium]MCC6505393.1 tRNA threonylcarbamoyladenosine dehydratase [Aquimonas sp.]OPZ12648.1 MAG: tRNA threonylcarbamoyladenosine dehydratase [Alphaproteobacteria bacterium ADurb.BinA280]
MEMSARFAGIDRLYGRGSVARLAQARIAIVGIGGVGSWAAEALTRSGVGHLTLIDADDICVSNVNRQLHALDGEFGRLKVDAMAERLRKIQPDIDVDAIAQFLTTDTMEHLLLRDFDYVLDACDAFRVKVVMAAFCRRRKIPLVIVGSAGGRSDPTQIEIRDLSRTEHDAMLALVRKKLRSEFHFPKNPDRYFGISAIFSRENVRYPQADGSVCGLRPAVDSGGRLDCASGNLGAATHVTASFAFAATGRILQRLTQALP